MRPLVVAALLLIAAACASPAPPTPSVLPASTSTPVAQLTASPGPTPTAATHVPSSPGPPSPTPLHSSLAPGFLAEVQKHVKQVADPQHPNDDSFQTSEYPAGRVLEPLERGYDVYLLESKEVDGRNWWRVADSSYVGCCAPFGWIPWTDSDGNPLLIPSAVYCPEATEHMTTYDFIHPEGSFEGAICFGRNDVTLRGYLACDRPAIDGALFLSGLNSYDQTGYECKLDDRMTVLGAIVPARGESNANTWHEVADVTGHYYAQQAQDCRWVPGDYMPMPVDDAPTDTAQFACQMEFFATSATPLP